MILRTLLFALLALPAAAQAVNKGVRSSRVPIEAAAKGKAGDAVREVHRLLRQVDDPRPPLFNDLVRSLARLGPAATEELAAIYVGVSEPPSSPENSVAAPEDPFAFTERPRMEDVIRATLRALPPGEVVAAIRIRAAGKVPLQVRVNGFRALGEVGSARAFEALIESLAELSPFERASPGVQEPAATALAAILAGGQHCWVDLERRQPELEPDLERILVRGIARSGSPRGFTLLLGLLQRPTADHAQLFEAIEELSLTAASGIEERDRAEIRCALESEDPMIRRSAAVVIGRVQDVASVPALLELLDHEDARLQRAAAWALESMSGLTLPAERPRWQAWYEEQVQWFDESVPILRRKLEAGEPAAAVEAIAEMSQRPLFRHLLAEELARPLAQGRTEVALAACAGLAELRSPLAIPDLVNALRRSEESVRQAAGDALHAITGLELPPDFNTWAEEVRP